MINLAKIQSLIKHYLLLVLCLMFLSTSCLKAQTHVPDQAFRSYLIGLGINFDANGNITNPERVASISKIEMNNDSGIISVSGIEAFINLKELEIIFNNESIDLSKNTLLTKLLIYSPELVSIDVSKNTLLSSLSFMRTSKLTSLDVSKNTLLNFLSIYDHKLTKLNLSKNTRLTYLKIDNKGSSNKKLESLDLTSNIKLMNLNLIGLSLKELDLSSNTKLNSVDISGNKISKLTFSKNTMIERMNLSYNELTDFDIYNHPLLKSLYLQNNKLTQLDLSKSLFLPLDVSESTFQTSRKINKQIFLKGNPFETGQPVSANESTYKKLVEEKIEAEENILQRKNMSKIEFIVEDYPILIIVLQLLYVIGILLLVFKKDRKKIRNIILNILIIASPVSFYIIYLNLNKTGYLFDLELLLIGGLTISIHLIGLVTKLIVLHKQSLKKRKI